MTSETQRHASALPAVDMAWLRKRAAELLQAHEVAPDQPALPSALLHFVTKAADALESLSVRIAEAEGRLAGTPACPEGSDCVKQCVHNFLSICRDRNDALNRAERAEKALRECRPFVAHFKGGWSNHTHGQISTDQLLTTIDAALSDAPAPSRAV